ncbi:hypothetical protein EDD16DRAFT_1554766 [Pisolithus croceorrhizus]|nr:hypothetical protein EDD16DRAFT_1554766 [Pisolithus croceorrhizus]
MTAPLAAIIHHPATLALAVGTRVPVTAPTPNVPLICAVHTGPRQASAMPLIVTGFDACRYQSHHPRTSYHVPIWRCAPPCVIGKVAPCLCFIIERRIRSPFRVNTSPMTSSAKVREAI